MFLEQLIGEGCNAAAEITSGFGRKRRHSSGHPQPHPHLIHEDGLTGGCVVVFQDVPRCLR